MSRAIAAKRGSSAGQGSRLPMPVPMMMISARPSHSRSLTRIGGGAAAGSRVPSPAGVAGGDAVTGGGSLATGAAKLTAMSATGRDDISTPGSICVGSTGGGMRRRGVAPWSRPISGIGTRPAGLDVHHQVIEGDAGRQEIGQDSDRVVLSPDEIRGDHGAAGETDDPET